jgi:hypothetical protein
MASVVWAYIDPGSGSILLQLIIATLIGSLAYFRRIILAPVVRIIKGKRVSDDSP